MVPAPHSRLGEQPAAFILVRDGHRPDPDDLSTRLRAKGMAPQKIPTVWRFVDEFPRTSSGKVLKYRLEEQVRQELEEN